MARPPVDVVIPFRGSAQDRRALEARLERLELRPDDSLVIVENRATPGYGRNRGAAQGSSQWLVFLDSDVTPWPDLLERYFDPPPGERTGLLGGGVVDEAVPADARPAARYAYLRGAMSQDESFGLGKWAYPKSTNVACRREAFESVGGFREDIRAAEDADLTYRLRQHGWEVERREGATVVHHNRQTIRRYVAQKLVHGAGGAWLNREYPDLLPPRRFNLGLLFWGLRFAARGTIIAARTRDRDELLWALFHPLEVLTWELGRSLPNERPLWRRS